MRDINNKLKIICKVCKNTFIDYISNHRRFCSHSCAAKITRNSKGKKLSQETKDKISRGFRKQYKKENHHRWVSDRTQLKTDRIHQFDSRYQEWSLCIKKRDNWKCKIADKNCSGRLESHHILPWKDYPELRYEMNNGITLCCFHHPRKRFDEKRLSPYFSQIVNNIN